MYTATIDLCPGSARKFLTTKDDEKTVGFDCDYLDIQEGKRLVFIWARMIVHANGKRDVTLPAEVQVDLSARGAATDDRLVHTVKRIEDWHLLIGEGWKQAFKALEHFPMRFTRRQPSSPPDHPQYPTISGGRAGRGLVKPVQKMRWLIGPVM